MSSSTAAELTGEKRLEEARQHAREIERFSYRLVGNAEMEREVKRARDVMRQAVGLRRMLEAWNGRR